MRDSQQDRFSQLPDSDPSMLTVCLSTAWRWKWHLVVSLVVSLILGVIYLLQATAIYEVQTRVLVQKEGLSFDRDRGPGIDKLFLGTQAEIIRSPLTLRRALKTVPISLPDGLEIDEVAYVLESLQVTPMLMTDVLKISYHSHVPQEAARLIRGIIESYEQHLREVDHGTYTDTLGLLTRREEALRSELQGLYEKYETVRSESPLVGQGSDTISVQMVLLERLGGQLSDTKSRRIDIENKLDALALARGLGTERGGGRGVALGAGAPGPNRVLRGVPSMLGQEEMLALASYGSIDRSSDLLKSRELAEIQGRLIQLQLESKGLERRFGYWHRQRRDIEGQIELWQSLLQDRTVAQQQLLGHRLTATESLLSHELVVATQTEANLSRIYEAERDRVKTLDNYLLKEDLLRRTIERVEQAHESTLVRFTEFQLADQALAGGQASVTVMVLDEPELSEELVWPRPLPVLLFSAIFGLVGGMLLISVLDQINPKVDSSGSCDSPLSNVKPLDPSPKGVRKGQAPDIDTPPGAQVA